MNRRCFMHGMAGMALAQSADRPIRVGLLGVHHGHLLGKLEVLRKSPAYEVAAACETNEPLRRNRSVLPQFRNLRWVSEDDLLSDASIQLILVESDVPDAIPLGMKVIRAGKHLHLEKPPGNRMAPFRTLVEEARRESLLVQLGYVWRFHRGFDLVREAWRSGWLGDVYMLRGIINTDLSLGGRKPLARYRSGMLFELGCHLIDRMVALAGRPLAVKRWLRHDTGMADGLADNTLGLLEFERCVGLVSSAARMAGASAHRQFEAVGTDGSMAIQPIEPGNRLRIGMREARGRYSAGWQEMEIGTQPRYVGDFQDMARAIRQRSPLTYSYEHELLTHETILRVCGEEEN